MSVMSPARLAVVLEPVLTEIFDGNYTLKPTEYDKVFTVKNGMKRRFHEEAVLAGLGNAVEKEEGASVTYDSGYEAYRIIFTYKTYALAFSLTEEMIEDSDHFPLGAMYTKHLVRSLKETKEIKHANVLNLGFSNTQKGGDGQPLFSANHPLAGGGTFSNVLDVASDLSEAAIEEFRTKIAMAKDERGKLISLRADKLVVHPSNYGNAMRILKSELVTGSNNNDINVIKQANYIPGGIVEMSRLVNPNQFIVTTDADNGLVTLTRAKISRGMEADFNTGNARFKARERYGLGWGDPRGAYSSPGV